jgi:hypothetical protein
VRCPTRLRLQHLLARSQRQRPVVPFPEWRCPRRRRRRVLRRYAGSPRDWVARRQPGARRPPRRQFHRPNCRSFPPSRKAGPLPRSPRRNLLHRDQSAQPRPPQPQGRLDRPARWRQSRRRSRPRRRGRGRLDSHPHDLLPLPTPGPLPLPNRKHRPTVQGIKPRSLTPCPRRDPTNPLGPASARRVASHNPRPHPPKSHPRRTGRLLRPRLRAGSTGLPSGSLRLLRRPHQRMRPGRRPAPSQRRAPLAPRQPRT